MKSKMLLISLAIASYNSLAMENSEFRGVQKNIEALKKLELAIVLDAQKLPVKTLLEKRQLLKTKIANSKNNPNGFMAQMAKSKETK